MMNTVKSDERKPNDLTCLKYQLNISNLAYKYLLIVLVEAPHQDSGALFTVPNKLCVIDETFSIALFTATAPAAVPGHS